MLTQTLQSCPAPVMSHFGVNFRDKFPICAFDFQRKIVIASLIGLIFIQLMRIAYLIFITENSNFIVRFMYLVYIRGALT